MIRAWFCHSAGQAARPDERLIIRFSHEELLHVFGRGNCYYYRGRVPKDRCPKSRTLATGIDPLVTFIEASRLLLDACPGPPLARKGLRIVALQAVPGIPGLDASQQQNNAPTTQHANLSRPRPAADSVRYISSTTQVALLLGCRPAYLSKAARNHGYSFSRTLRWIRFLHAMALLSEGCRVETMVWKARLRRHRGVEQVHNKAGGTLTAPVAGAAAVPLGAKSGRRRLFGASGDRIASTSGKKGLN